LFLMRLIKNGPQPLHEPREPALDERPARPLSIASRGPEKG
jgi:hypothetical protein